jgi:capsule polysaccharide export protein KpsE/RkpR
LSDIFGKLKSGAGKVAHEADKTAHIKRIEMQIGSTNKQIEDHYQKLGEMVYEAKVKGEPENPEVANIQTKITDLKQQIAVREQEIKDIKEDKVVTPTAAPGKKFCTSCGKENDAAVKFCAECGAKMG